MTKFSQFFSFDCFYNLINNTLILIIIFSISYFKKNCILKYILREIYFIQNPRSTLEQKHN